MSALSELCSQVSADSIDHRRRAELHHRVPAADGDHGGAHGERKQKMKLILLNLNVILWRVSRYYSYELKRATLISEKNEIVS